MRFSIPFSSNSIHIVSHNLSGIQRRPLGCPRKLVKGYISKWVITPIYPIYKWVISYEPFTNHLLIPGTFKYPDLLALHICIKKTCSICSRSSRLFLGLRRSGRLRGLNPSWHRLVHQRPWRKMGKVSKNEC